ncbi:MAG: nitroreductase/quinone reductase family protein, partial [Acidimicrobiia bacterium]
MVLATLSIVGQCSSGLRPARSSLHPCGTNAPNLMRPRLSDSHGWRAWGGRHTLNRVPQVGDCYRRPMRDSSIRRWSRAHRRLFQMTRGRLGKRLADNDMLLLTTSGRATGEAHTVPLLYLRDGDRLVV